MTAIYIILGFFFFISVITLYAKDIQRWNEKHLLSRGPKKKDE